MRNKLIENLANGWRKAETYFIETHKDFKKWEMKEKQDKANLTKKETEELNNILTSMGV